MTEFQGARESVVLDELSALLRFPFRGKSGQSRFLVGSALLLGGMFVPILPAIFVYGYLVRLMRGVMRGEPAELPAWELWGELFMDGLKAMVVAFAYLLPGTLSMLAGFVAYFLAGPVSIAMMSAGRSGSDASPALLLGLLGGMAVMLLGMSLGFFLSFLGAVPLPAALARFVESGRLGDAFHLRAIWRLVRAQGWRYFAAWVVVMGLIGTAYILYTLIYFTWILCAVGMVFIAPAMFYVLSIGAVIFGRFYAQYGAPRSTPVMAMSPEVGSDPAI